MTLPVEVNPLLMGGGGYKISRSLRFRSSASAYLSRTTGSASNQKTWTWSGWVKRGALGGTQALFTARSATNPLFLFEITSDQLTIFARDAGGTTIANYTSAAVLRDPSAWYHIVLRWDALSSSMTIYVNNVAQTLTTTTAISNVNYAVNSAIVHEISRHAFSATEYLDGYLAEVNFIDGQALTPSSFGENDATTGVWKPKAYTGTYGTNGFYLKFADNSAATAAAIGKDSSGNGNNWTPTNISVTAGVTYDSMIDTPTPYDDGTVYGVGNYCVLNSLSKVTTSVLADANLSTTSVAAQIAIGSIGVTSGKWYWECAFSAATSTQKVGVYGTSASTATVTATTNTIGLKFDAGTGALDYTTDGTNYTSIATGLTSGPYFPYIESATNAKVMYANFGQRPFTYTPPSGFKALNTQNLP